jgi:hypothetical protein
MFEQATSAEPRNAMGDCIAGDGVALFFVSVKLFQEIGAGQWFRHFTGIVEILGGILALIPWTVIIGLALLGCTMASAAPILVFVVGRLLDSIVSGFWPNRSHR